MTEPEAQQPAKSHGPTESAITNGDDASLHDLCKQLHHNINAFLQEESKEERIVDAQSQCRNSLNIIEEAIRRYPLQNLSFSYNGGKDCLVLLLLYLSCLHDHPSLPPSLSAIYIPPTHPFPVVDEFVATSSAHYHLALARHTSPNNSMKDAFASYLSSPDGQAIQAILVGTRRTDPHGGQLREFDVTDRGWPEFMRVHPVLEWRYVEVWAFLRALRVDWCSLYDQGFTSLGGVGDTHPNPKLKRWSVDGKERYEPAWVLEEDLEERLGRG